MRKRASVMSDCCLVQNTMNGSHIDNVSHNRPSTTSPTTFLAGEGRFLMTCAYPGFTAVNPELSSAYGHVLCPSFGSR